MVLNSDVHVFTTIPITFVYSFSFSLSFFLNFFRFLILHNCSSVLWFLYLWGRNCICLWIKYYTFLLPCLMLFTFWSFLYLCNTSEHSGFIITPAVTSNKLCIFPYSVLWVSSNSDSKYHFFFLTELSGWSYHEHAMFLLWGRIWTFKLNLQWFWILKVQHVWDCNIGYVNLDLIRRHYLVHCYYFIMLRLQGILI